MVGRLETLMVGVATVPAEGIDITAAARPRWGRCARICSYSRYHNNKVGLPSDDLTRGGR